MRLIKAEDVCDMLNVIADSKAITTKHGAIAVAITALDDIPAIDIESLRPQGRCRYCSHDDGCGLEWDFEDIEVSATLRCGTLTISNQYGDEAEMPIKYCPICGAKMITKEEPDGEKTV